MNTQNPIPEWAVMAAYIPCFAATFYRDPRGQFRLANGRFAPRAQTESLEPNTTNRISKNGVNTLIKLTKGGL